jgi:hypothetical protein
VAQVVSNCSCNFANVLSIFSSVGGSSGTLLFPCRRKRRVTDGSKNACSHFNFRYGADHELGGIVNLIAYERVGHDGCRPSSFSWRIRYAQAHKKLDIEFHPMWFSDVETIEKLSGQKFLAIRASTLLPERRGSASFCDRALAAANIWFVLCTSWNVSRKLSHTVP